MKHAKAALAGIVCFAVIGVSLHAAAPSAEPHAATTRPADSTSFSEIARSLLDEKWVAKGLAKNHEGTTDIVVRVDCWQGPKWKEGAIPKAVPPGAKLTMSTELMASYGKRFYSTIRQTDQRIELGGVIRPSSDGYLMCTLAFGNRNLSGIWTFSSNVMLKLGQTQVISGDAEGTIITVTLDSPEK